jgi:hypothetical protein
MGVGAKNIAALQANGAKTSARRIAGFEQPVSFAFVCDG